MIKGCRSISEYAIRRWMEERNFVMSRFELTVDGNVGVIKDQNGDELKLLYDGEKKVVYVDE